MSINEHTRPHFVRGVRLRWDNVRSQHMLLFPEGALVLNATAFAVLELCDGKRSINEIAAKLEQQYQSANVKNDVCHLLARIAERGLLVCDNG